MSSENYHEPVELLSSATRERHRAVVSLMEELDAIDWYQQRAEASTDAELRSVLLHNMREEVEHAMMILEWLRRNDATFREKIGVYIGSEGPITKVEAASAPRGAGRDEGSGRGGSLGIGSLKGA